MVLTLSSASPYSPTNPSSIYQQHREVHNASLEPQAQHRATLLNRMSLGDEDGGPSAAEYSTVSQQQAALHHGHPTESAEHSPVASKNVSVAHSQYSHHNLPHNTYDAFYTSSGNSGANSSLVISSTGQILNGHATPTVVQYAAPTQHHVSELSHVS